MKEKEIGFTVIRVGRTGLKFDLYGLYLDDKPVLESAFDYSIRMKYKAKFIMAADLDKEAKDYAESINIRVLTGDDCDLAWTLELVSPLGSGK